MRIDVTFLPPERPPEAQTCLVIDVLRATSCMAVLFGRGLEAIHPAASIEAARAIREELRDELGDGVGLFGEQDALPPDGFDRGNSPSEFARIPLPWREAVVATTNGTPALLACAGAPLVLAAAPLNASAVTEAALAAGHDVLVVCAGRRGHYADDDALAAGLLVRRLVAASAEPDAEARRALDLIDGARDGLAAAMRATGHGQDLVRLGFGHDIAFCAESDRYDVAAALQREAGRYVLRPLAPTVG